MKAYLITTGIVFAAIVAMHGLRVYFEGMGMMRRPEFILLTLFSAALSVWAWCLLGRMSRSR